MLERTQYKDRPAFRLTTSKMQALFLPEDGGKLASISDGEQEYLAQAPGEKYQRLFPDSDYVASECSGFDDMFPTIDPIISDWPGLIGAKYLDHGEVCRYPMDAEVYNDVFRLSFASRELPVRFEKRIQGDPVTGDIHIDYRLENLSDVPVPYIWAAHCMLQGDAEGQILLPFPANAPIRTMFGRQLARDGMEPFSPEGESYKYYFTEPIPTGRIGFRHGNGRTIWLYYPENVVKYLGVWINNGSFKGMYNIALEPCTAPYDRPDAAEAAGTASYLPPKCVVTFRLTIRLTETEDVL